MMNYKSVLATIELLSEQFPQCFSVFEQRRKPLKLGIHKDLTMEPKVLSAVLRFYCMNTFYLAATVEGAARIDLNGEACGTVSSEEAAGAKLRLEQLHERHKRRQVAKEQAERKAKNKGRLSLDDLRKAAQARRAA